MGFALYAALLLLGGEPSEAVCPIRSQETIETIQSWPKYQAYLIRSIRENTESGWTRRWRVFDGYFRELASVSVDCYREATLWLTDQGYPESLANDLTQFWQQLRAHAPGKECKLPDGMDYITKNFKAEAIEKSSSCPFLFRKRESAVAIYYDDTRSGQKLFVDQFESACVPGSLVSKKDCDSLLKQHQCFKIGENSFLGTLKIVRKNGNCGIHITDHLQPIQSDAVSFVSENLTGYQALKDGNYPKAMKHLKQSLELNPNYRHSNFNMACTMALMGMPYSAGKPYLEKLLKNPELYPIYRKKVLSDPDLASWRKKDAFLSWFQGISPVSRAKTAQKNLSDSQKKAREYHRKGLQSFIEKKYPESIAYFKKALEEDSNYLASRMSLASVLAQTGKAKVALEELKKSYSENKRLTELRIGSDQNLKKLAKNL